MDKKDMVNVIHIHLKWGKEPSDPSLQWKQSKSCKAHGGSRDGSLTHSNNCRDCQINSGFLLV